MSRPPWAVAAACAAALLALAPAARACGICVEDKVAATYDHAVVTRAIDRGQVVVFAEVKGGGSAASLTSAARKAALRVRGIDPRSVRTAQEPAGLSFALDLEASAPGAALAAVERATGMPGLKLPMLKVMR